MVSTACRRLAARAGVAGFIIPDLPYEESADMRAALDRVGLALVQMVTPVTPAERLKMLCEASQGFVYAVTMTGTTGRNVAVPDDVLDYMDRVRAVSPVPVCAGFGIRSAEQVARFRNHVDGVVVGSALVEVLERREDPAAFLRLKLDAAVTAVFRCVDDQRAHVLQRVLFPGEAGRHAPQHPPVAATAAPA
jgi:tryptophan synthase alpha chain